MENTNNYSKFLPQLLDRNVALIDKVDKMVALNALLLKERPRAEIPPEEIDKLRTAIKMTPCAAPNSEQLSHRIADGVVADVKEDVKGAVKETVRGMKIPLEHTYYYSRLGDAWHLVEKDFQRWFLVISVFCSLLIIVFGSCLLVYYNSEAYWGNQYEGIVLSEYITEQEREILKEDRFTTGSLPREYKSNPELIKEIIRQNKLVIKGRKKQAAKNKGEFGTNPSIQR